MKKYLISAGIAALAFISVASAQSYNFGADLYLGTQGNDVASLQTYLISNGFNIPAISSGAQAKGYFGTQTQAALAAYQRSVGINPTGYLGPQTRAWINSHGNGNNGNGNGGNGCPTGYSCNNSLRVISPNGGEVMQKGTSVNIVWSVPPVPYQGVPQYGTIKLEYPTPACALPTAPIQCMVKMMAPLTLASNVNLSSGSYQWLAGVYQNSSQIGLADCGPFYSTTGQCISSSNIIADGQYRVQVCSNDGSVCDDSDNTFTVTSNTQSSSNIPVITSVQGPTSIATGISGLWNIQVANNPFNTNLTTSVNWGDTNCASGYSCANAQPFAPNTGSQANTSLTHTYTSAGTYTITFTVSNSYGSAQATRSVVVTGNSNGGAGPLRIISPNGGEVWQKGTTHTITWTSPQYFAAAYADLKVTQKYNCTTQVCPAIAYAPFTIATNIPINQNSYNWNVGTAMNFNSLSATLPDGQYTVQICQTGSSSCDTSDNTFTITSGTINNSSITVTSPNGGEQWAANSTHQIAWNAYNVGYTNAVDIYLGNTIIPPCIAIYPVPASCGGTFQISYVLDKNIGANTTYNWIVGTDINNNTIPAGTYTIEVCQAGSTSNCDTSNSAFSIYGTAYPANTTGGYNNGYYQQPGSSVYGCPAGYVCTPAVSSTQNPVPNVSYSY